MNRIYFCLICFIALYGCGNRTEDKAEDTGEDSLVSCEVAKDSLLMVLSHMEDGDCLVYWISDTVCANYSGLVLLLDTLYQHVRSDEYSENPEIEEKWMKSYRKRICEHYDRYNKGNESMSEFKKAELVLKEGTRLVELNCDYSTMEMVVKNSIEITFARLSEYGLLTQMIGRCKNKETKNLVYKEWEQLENIRQDMIDIVDGLVQLSYWTGSGGISIRTERWLDFSDARKIMYQNILNLVDGKNINDDDCYDNDAIEYVTDHLTKATRDIYSSWKDDQNDDSPLMSEKEWKEYQLVAKETDEAIKKIRPSLKKWINQWSELDAQLTPQNNQMKQIASKMLIEWAYKASYMEEHRFSE